MDCWALALLAMNWSRTSLEANGDIRTPEGWGLACVMTPGVLGLAAIRGTWYVELLPAPVL